MTTKPEKGITNISEDEEYPIPSPPLRPFWEISGLTLDEVSKEMGTVTFGVSSVEETNEHIKAAFRGEKQPPRMDFPSAERLFTIMTPERWGLIRKMAGAGALSVPELARRVERDPDSVYADIRALLNCGVLYSTGDGRIIFPFKAVHIDVLLEAAA
jgi:predicted transcriptional regulator